MSSIVDVGGVRVVADMLNKMGPKAIDILKNINGIDTYLATRIKDNMFVFEDLLNLDVRIYYENYYKVLSQLKLQLL